MSKARLVITAVVVEGRSQSEVAREYGVSQGWISRLVNRYRMEGATAFEPRSRRPHTSPTRLPRSTIDLIVELREKLASKGLDNGPHTIAWHLMQHHQLRVSAMSITRHLRAAGLVSPAPKKRPKASYIRPIISVGGGRLRRVTYADILGPVNEGREERDRVSYSSLWVHAKRHYDADAMLDYWAGQINKRLRNALGGRRSAGPIE